MSEPYKLTYITTDAKLAGTERVIISLISKMDRSRFEPSVISLIGPGDLQTTLADMGVESHALGVRGFAGIPGAMLKLRRLLENMQPDIAVTYLFHACFLGRSAGHWAGVPVMLSGQEDMDTWRRGYHNFIDKMTLSWANGVIANSNAVKAGYIKHTGIPEDKVHVIPNGLDLERFKQHTAEQKEKAGNTDLRAELGIDPDIPIIGQVANLSTKKDHLNLLKALRIVADKGISFMALLIGSGYTEPQIDAAMNELQLHGYVKKLGYRHDVERIVNEIDVLTLSSYEEGMPIAILEAMAAHKPVVSTRAGGIGEVVADGKTGILVPIRNSEELAKALVIVLSDPEMRGRMGEAGHKRLIEGFTLDRQAEAHQELYLQALGA